MYEIVEVGGSKTEPAVKVITYENPDGTILWIPEDPANSDYQRYLQWLEEQA